MPTFTPQRYEQILPRMLARVITRSPLSDVTDSSVLKHIVAAVAREVDQLYYQATLISQVFSIDTAQGADLDARAKDIQPGTLMRQTPSTAVGSVVFSRSIVGGTVTVPVGTQIKTASGQVFQTTLAATITATSAVQLTGHVAGQDSGTTPVTAVAPGSAGNVAVGTIIKFVARPIGVDTVTNVTTTTQGTDAESDVAFRQRLKNYIASLPRATVSALESGVLGRSDPVSGATILFAKAVEDPVNLGRVSLYIDDGTGAASSTFAVSGEVVTQGSNGPSPNTAVGGETGFYLKQIPIVNNSLTLTSSLTGTWTAGNQYTINNANGYIGLTSATGATRGDQITAAYTAYQGLVALGQKVVDGSAADRTNYPGLRAIGTLVTVLPPQTVAVNVVAGITVRPGYDVPTAQAAGQAAALGYLNGLTIGQSVQVASLVQFIMEAPGISNVALQSPTSDVFVSPFQLVRVVASNVTVS